MLRLRASARLAENAAEIGLADAVDLQMLQPRVLAADDAHRAARTLQRLGDQFLERGVGGALHRRSRDARLEIGPAVRVAGPALDRIASAARREVDDEAQRRQRRGFVSSGSGRS